MKISEIYTKANADKGATIQVPFGKGKRKPTLKIYGQDGDFFEARWRENAIELSRILTLPLCEQAEAKKEADFSLVASFIIEWSFVEECTAENKLKLLKESPGIFELVNEAVFDRSLFV